MTIQELLQQTMARVSYANRWMVRGLDGDYRVYERDFGRRLTLINETDVSLSTLIIETGDENAAVEALLEGER